jgi:hypothetical protein
VRLSACALRGVGVCSLSCALHRGAERTGASSRYFSHWSACSSFDRSAAAKNSRAHKHATHSALNVSYSAVLWGTRWYSGVLKGTLRYSMVLKSSLRYSAELGGIMGVLWGTQGYSGVLKGTQG